MSQLDYATQPVSSSTTALQRLFSTTPGIVVLLALVIFCYHKTATFEYIWDDDAYVVNNSTLDDLNGLSRIWTEVGATPQYYPMTFTSFWIERQVFGGGAEAAKPQHIVNMLLHAGNVILLFWILKKLNVPGAWLAAAIFAVHPINIESVAWVAERKNVLSLFFGLSALWVYLHYCGLIAREKPAEEVKKVVSENEEGESEGGGLHDALPSDPKRLYFLFFLLFVLGLLSKTTVSVLPVVILIITWWKRGRLGLKDVLPLIVPTLLAVAGGMMTSYVEHNPYLVGASGEEWNRAIPDRVALVGQTSWFYVGKMLLPHPFILGNSGVVVKDGSMSMVLNLPQLQPYLPVPLMFNYFKWNVDSAQPVQWVGLIGLLIVTGGLFALRSRIGRGAFACAICYSLCLLPASGLFNFFPMQFSWVADHFVYIAAIPIFVIFAAAGTMIWNRLNMAVRDTYAGIGAAVVLGWLLFVGSAHINTFGDLKNLWQFTLARNPKSWMAAGNLGSYWLNASTQKIPLMLASGDDSETAVVVKENLSYAKAWLGYANKINPRAYQVLYWQGRLAYLEGDIAKAMELFDRSDEVAREKGAKTWIYPRMDKATAYIQQRDFPKAIAIYDSCLEDEKAYGRRLPQTFARMHISKAKYFESLSNIYNEDPKAPHDQSAAGEAIEEYGNAINVAPTWNLPKLRLARLLMETNSIPLALQYINDVLRSDKNSLDGKFLTGIAALKLGEPQSAGAQLANLLKLYPEYWPAYPKLADALVQLDRRKDAITQLNYCLKQNPNYEPAKKALAKIEAMPATQPVK